MITCTPRKLTLDDSDVVSRLASIVNVRDADDLQLVCDRIPEIQGFDVIASHHALSTRRMPLEHYSLFRNEFDTALGLMGCADIDMRTRILYELIGLLPVNPISDTTAPFSFTVRSQMDGTSVIVQGTLTVNFARAFSRRRFFKKIKYYNWNVHFSFTLAIFTWDPITRTIGITQSEN